jgi:hypothetical protein
MLTRVDLPAPLVPITACTSPRRSSIETFCTAARPPKRRVRPAACSSTRSDPAPRRQSSSAASAGRGRRRNCAGRPINPFGIVATNAMIVRPERQLPMVGERADQPSDE